MFCALKMMNSKHPPICDYEGSDYQTSFWEKGGRVYEDRVEAVALRRLLPEKGHLLLEVGAGAGRNAPRYHAFERVVLLDYARSQLQQAQERLGEDGRFIYVAADAYQLPFAPGLFDTATMIRTLHHMVDAPLVLRQVRQVLQPGGTFLLEYPNKRNVKAILRYLLKRQDWNPFSPEPIEFAALNFDFHPDTVRTWLRQNGFDVERQLTVSHYRMRALKRLVPLDILVTMDSLVSLTGDWWQLSPSVFVRSRAVGDTPFAPQGVFFRCPNCGDYPLDETSGALCCSACGKKWPIHDGIYDFRA